METIEIKDPYTGEKAVFAEATKKYNGDDITAADNVVYKYEDGKYYRRILPDGFVNIKWFGAMGDGTTDDSAAIQKAVDTFCSIRFEPGIYIVNTPIKFNINYSGKTFTGAGSDIWDKNSTIITTQTDGTIFEGLAGFNTAVFSNFILDGNSNFNNSNSVNPTNHVGSIGMDFTLGGGLTFEKIVVKNFAKYGLFSKEGLLRINNCYFRNNKIGASIYSDTSISNSEFTEGETPLKLVAGGNRLVNVWINSGTVSCLDLEPLNTETGHQNTSITNLYIGEVASDTEGYAIRILGNDVKRVQQVHISNSFFVHATEKSINGLVKIDKADEIILNGINVLGLGLYANSHFYTSHYVKGTNANRVTITSCVINGVNKNAIYQGDNSYDWEITDNTFNNCGDNVAQGDEGANIYVTPAMGRTSIINNKFLVASQSSIPYAAYVFSVESLNWDNNFIAYPSPIIVKDPTYLSTVENNFSGSFYRNGTLFKTINQANLTSSSFESGYARPNKNLRNAQFFYDNNLKKPIWYNEVSSKWKDSSGLDV